MKSFLLHWPALRTVSNVRHHIRLRAALLGGTFSVFSPFLIGIIGSLLLFGLEHTGFVLTSDGPAAILALMTFTIFATLPLQIVAIPAAMFAMRVGYAGWLTAIVFGGLTALVAFVYLMPIEVESLPIGFGVGSTFGVLFWLGARLSTPAAFLSS